MEGIGAIRSPFEDEFWRDFLEFNHGDLRRSVIAPSEFGRAHETLLDHADGIDGENTLGGSCIWQHDAEVAIAPCGAGEDSLIGCCESDFQVGDGFLIRAADRSREFERCAERGAEGETSEKMGYFLGPSFSMCGGFLKEKVNGESD